ncbi:MAG: CYTH domain-containing protein [Candidatus Helarchaeota archaeon]
MGIFHEYEVKIRLDDPSKLTSEIKKLNGKILKEVTQFDTYYDFENLELTKKDVNLRIRKEFNANNDFVNAEFSFKGSRRGKFIEIRPDISIQFLSETEINKLDIILKKLGYRRLILFIKQRERWKLGTIEFEIDKKIIAEDETVKIDIGSFCQATIETNKDVEDGEINKILWKSLNRLGYDFENFEERSYIELYFIKKKK